MGSLGWSSTWLQHKEEFKKYFKNDIDVYTDRIYTAALQHKGKEYVVVLETYFFFVGVVKFLLGKNSLLICL